MSDIMFEHLRSQRIDTLNLEAHEYRHQATGARHLHLAADDNNNVFAVAFHTIPRDSSGVAHILEHTVLCGSRRFPVRDPFFMMTRRSLNTFMNAFTGSDWTAYPFASQNQKDFNNLLQVYLDAVFFPRLDELDFAQEGHRVEFESASDPATDLVFKGVVYNEMRGAMSSPIARLWQALSAELFPTTTYHYNSGGEPDEIPNLGYDALKAFHARHYHPSNAFFATYGDVPVEEHHTRFHEWALKHFEAKPTEIRVPDEARYAAPRAVSVPYALDREEDTRDKTHIVIGWLLGLTADSKEMMNAQLLAGVLLDHSASPLRHALETTALGTAPSELCGIESANREATFACGLEGSNPEHAQAVERLVMGVIRDVAERGVPVEMAESVLHQMEIAQREIRGGAHPYGLQLLEAVIPVALHGGDPIAALALDPVLEDLRSAIAEPDFIKGLARRWLVDNPHRVQVVMAPDKDLSMRHAGEIKARLARLKEAMSADEKDRVVQRAAALQDRQSRVEDPNILPKVGLEDVPPDLKITEGREDHVGGTPTTWFSEGTNGLVYEDIVVELPELTPDQVDCLRLYCNCVTEVGCGERDYLAVQGWQAAVSGGISAHCAVRGSVGDVQRTQAFLRLQANGLARKHAALAQLLRETFVHARFDELERLRELIAQIYAAREAQVTDHGHVLAMAAACAGMGPAAALSHQWDGLLGLKRLKVLLKSLDAEAGAAELASRFAGIHERLTQAHRQLLVVSEARHQDAIASALRSLWSNGTAPPVTRFQPEPVAGTINVAWATSTEVNFCARAYPTVPPDHPDAPVLIVLGRFLHNGYLHRAIREQGGAYGSGAGYEGDSGAFRFYSYRDPRLAETLEDFDRSLRWLEREQHGYRQLEEAILGVISTIDRPSSPAGEAIKAFVSKLYGRTPEHLRRLRQRVLAVGLEDLRRVAETYLIPERASTAIVSNLRTLDARPQLELEVKVL